MNEMVTPVSNIHCGVHSVRKDKLLVQRLIFLVFGAIHSTAFWDLNTEWLSFCCSSIDLFLSESRSDVIFLCILKLCVSPTLPLPTHLFHATNY